MNHCFTRSALAKFRTGGQHIDVRGAARTVLERMGLQQTLANLGTNGPTAELEILRGDPAQGLYDHSKTAVTYQVDDRLTAVQEVADAVPVTFAHGEPASFDLVVVTKGLNSTTRQLVFGAEVRRRIRVGSMKVRPQLLP